jgi:RNA polymerase sigma-70 factor (ECF subfamily)
MNGKELTQPENWVAEHGDYLFQFAFVRLRNRAAAEDAVQETFLAGIKALDRYDGKTPVRYWLRGILRHKVVDYIRIASREIVPEASDGEDITDSITFKAFGIPTPNPPPWTFDPKHAFEQKEFWEMFYVCMSKLPDAMGLAFTLRELEGISTEEICKEMKLKPNNLWVVLHRARMQLKACIESKWMDH